MSENEEISLYQEWLKTDQLISFIEWVTKRNKALTAFVKPKKTDSR